MHNYKTINFPFVFFVRHVYASYYDSSVKHCLFKTAVNVAIYACLASCFLVNLRSKKDSNCYRLITETLLCDWKSDISIRSINKQEQEFY